MRVPCQWPSTRTCRIAFIGEAPSDEEIIHQPPMPFVGPAGRVFNAAMRTANLERTDYLVSNVFDEQADNNDVTPWMHEELEICQRNFARLTNELQIVKPDVIVPMGGTALWAFTGYKNISLFRGSTLKATRILPGAKLLPSYHPAAVHKNWSLLPLLTGDFIKASAEADLGPNIVYPKVQLLVEPTLQDIREFADECQASPKLSVDIETGWGTVTSIAFAPSETRAISIPFMDLRKPSKSYWPTAVDEQRAWQMVHSICASDVPKVGQNFLYDIMWLYCKYGIAVRNYRYDTRLRHKVLFPELAADLASMVGSYTRIGAYKHFGHRGKKAEKKDG